MKKIFTLFVGAVFVLLHVSAQEVPGVYTVWQKTWGSETYLSTTPRSMTIYDGDLYIPNNGAAQKIDVVSTEDASLKKTITPSTNFASSWALNSIAFTRDGVMLTGSSQIGAANLFLYQWTDLDAGTYVALPAIPITGRTDYFAFWGEFNGAEEGRIAGAATSSQGNLNFASVSSGVVGPITTHENFASFGTGATVAFLDKSTIVYGAQNVAKTIYNLDTKEAIVVKGTAASLNGASVACFKFKGYDYVVSAEDRFGALKILDITNGGANAEIIHSIPALGAAANGNIVTPICVDVKSDHVMIYVLAVNNGLVAYKFIPEKQVADVVVTPVIQPEAGEYNENITITITTETPGATIRYTLDGTDPTESSTEYTAPFELAKPEGLGDVTVKAKAWLAGWDASEVASVIYTFTTVGIGQEEVSALKVYSANGQIVVETEVAASVEIFNLQGQKVVSDKAVQSVNQYTLDRGIYIVKVQGKSIKVIL